MASFYMPRGNHKWSRWGRATEAGHTSRPVLGGSRRPPSWHHLATLPFMPSAPPERSRPRVLSCHPSGRCAGLRACSDGTATLALSARPNSPSLRAKQPFPGLGRRARLPRVRSFLRVMPFPGGLLVPFLRPGTWLPPALRGAGPPRAGFPGGPRSRDTDSRNR